MEYLIQFVVQLAATVVGLLIAVRIARHIWGGE